MKDFVFREIDEKSFMKNSWFWPKGLYTGLVLFMIATLGFTFFSFFQRVDLVRKDYYEQDIFWNERKKAEERAFAYAPTIMHKNNILRIQWPSAFQKNISNASFNLHLYLYDNRNPSNDQRISSIVKNCLFEKKIDVAKGKWKIILEYKIENKNYYFEKYLNL